MSSNKQRLVWLVVVTLLATFTACGDEPTGPTSAITIKQGTCAPGCIDPVHYKFLVLSGNPLCIVASTWGAPGQRKGTISAVPIEEGEKVFVGVEAYCSADLTCPKCSGGEEYTASATTGLSITIKDAGACISMSQLELADKCE